MADKTYNTIMLEKLTELVASSAKAEVQLDNIGDEVKAIKEQDIKQNKLLDEHILGVKTNTKRLEEEIMARLVRQEALASRIETLEAPSKFYSTLNSKVLKICALIAALGGAAAAIYKIYSWI